MNTLILCLSLFEFLTWFSKNLQQRNIKYNQYVSLIVIWYSDFLMIFSKKARDSVLPKQKTKKMFPGKLEQLASLPLFYNCLRKLCSESVKEAAYMLTAFFAQHTKI